MFEVENRELQSCYNKNTLNKTFLVIVVLVIIGVGIFFFTRKQGGNEGSSVDSSMPVPENNTIEGKKVSKEGYSGNLLAGSGSPYLEFTKADYDKALSEGKVIFLEFYADWCPICRAQTPDLNAGFDSLSNPNVVGFRVNYNDSETDVSEKDIAKQFNITYQHTHVILKNGKEVYRSSDQLSKEDFLEVVADAVGSQ